MAKRVGDLELDQDLEYQQREWMAERISWVVWLLLLLAALLGILGSGPVSNATAGSQDGPLWVEYQRLARHRSPTTIIVHTRPEIAQDGTLQLQFDQEFIGKVQIERIDPEPDQVQIGMGRITYSFQVSEGDAPLHIIYHMQLETMGSVSTPLGIVGGPEVTVSQFVYP
jgi:hypothetical protein